MRNWLFALIGLIFIPTFSQTEYDIEDFSEQFYGKVIINESLDESNDRILIFNKENNEKLIDLETYGLNLNQRE